MFRRIAPLIVMVALLVPLAVGCAEEQKTGFSGCNINCGGGLMGGDGRGNVYYRSEADNWHLYKARLDGSNKVKLSDDVPCEINVLGGWVYYANYRDGFSLYRIRTDGTGRQLLKAGYCQGVYVAGDAIFYGVRNAEDVPCIHRMNLDGSEDKEVIADARLMYWYDDCLYYLGDRLYLWRYDLATGAKTQLSSVYSECVTVDATGVYYFAPDETKLYHTSQDGTDTSVILSGGDYYNVSDGAIYYMKYGGAYDFYRYDLADGTETQLTSFLPGCFDAKGAPIEDVESLSPDAVALHEAGTSLCVLEGHCFLLGVLRECLLTNGRAGCLIRAEPGGVMTVWD